MMSIDNSVIRLKPIEASVLSVVLTGKNNARDEEFLRLVEKGKRRKLLRSLVQEARASNTRGRVSATARSRKKN